MTVKISYLNKPIAKTSANEILFVDEKFNISKIKKFISNTEFFYINDLLKTNDLKKKILFFDVNSKKKLVLISIKKDLKGEGTSTSSNVTTVVNNQPSNSSTQVSNTSVLSPINVSSGDNYFDRQASSYT